MTKSKPKAKSASTSKSKPKPVTAARLKRAIEGRNARAPSALYGEDAVVQVIDRDNPPSKHANWMAGVLSLPILMTFTGAT